jgi:hypothetical protein
MLRKSLHDRKGRGRIAGVARPYERPSPSGRPPAAPTPIETGAIAWRYQGGNVKIS